MSERIPDSCMGRIAIAIATGGRRITYRSCENRPTVVRYDLCGPYYYCDECDKEQP